MLKAAVIGDPITQSKSPIIHRYWMERHRIDGTFEAIQVQAHELADQCKKLVDQGFSGFSVTVPHKETIISHCQTLDHAAQKIGAVNCVVIRNGVLHGMNTDAYGFITNLEPHIFSGRTALVLGAGGATRAVIYALQEKGFSVRICNRTRDRAEIVARDFKIEVVNWDARNDALFDIDLLVNCTTLGMQGQPPLVLDLQALPQHAVVTDIVYNPLITGLLERAQKKGHAIQTGIGMLAYQAVPAFEAWFGIKPEVDSVLLGKLVA